MRDGIKMGKDFMGDFRELRICKDCHEGNLEYNELVYIKNINIYKDELKSIGIVYKCEICGCIDVWIESEGVWCSDYGWIKGLVGEYL